jgi:transposase
MPTERMDPPPGASPPMRMTASWSGSNALPYTDPMQRGGKTLVNRRRPPLSRGATNASRYHSCCSRADLQPGGLCHFVRLVRAESFDMGYNSAGVRQQQMSKHTLAGGDACKLLDLLARLKSRAEQRIAAPVKVVAIQEVGLDGFWIHRLLEANGVESHVVDPASIAVPRRHRRAKTDAIDGETLLRTLMAWQRGEPRVCAMTVPPSPSEEDRRRVSRERATLLRERIRHTNRIRGLLFGQGITNYNPLHKNRREGLEELRTGDGLALPAHLKAEILREIDRLELVLRQINEVEAERDELLRPAQASSPVALLMRLKGIGPEFAAVLYLEGLFRHFENRRQLAAYAGLAPSPWKSGSVDHEQGISKAGNPRLRTTMIELAWMWVRYQPASALSCWFRQRVGSERGRIRRITIVALARKLLIALSRYVTHGEIPAGALMKAG